MSDGDPVGIRLLPLRAGAQRADAQRADAQPGDAQPGDAQPGDPQEASAVDPARRPEPIARSVWALIFARLQDAVRACAAIGGVLVVVWLVLSLTLGFSLVVFTTGSMSPTLPTGAGAITRPVAAADLAVGDIVTVPVAGRRLPITHRIIAIEPTGDPSTRSLVLKGDDNDTPDAEPYLVSEVDRVIIGAPGVGRVVSALAQPASLGAITVLVSGLVVWAFWPRRARG